MSGGVFSKSARPLRPGAYFNWVASIGRTITPSIGSIVAIPFTSDWGPFKVPTLVTSFQQYLAVFGPTVGTPGYNAAWLAFNGERGFDGRFGAGGVLCYRTGGSAAAKATRVLNNTGATPALTLTAKYEGSFGNGLRVTTQDHAADATFNELLIYNGTVLLETYVYLDTDIASLVSQVNLNSDWVTATLTLDGTALTAVSSSALTGGADGSTLLTADWTALLSNLESEEFGVFSAYGVTDTAVLAQIKAWASGAESGVPYGLNAKGRRFEVVVGGITDEAASAAVARSATFQDGNFVNVAMGHIRESELLNASGAVVTLSPAQFSAAVAGVIAQRGEQLSLTSARFPGATLLNGPNSTDIATCLNGGVIVFSQDSDPDAPMHIEAARTTFTKGAPGGPAADPNFPYLIYRNPKFMRTMQTVEEEFTQWANRTLIGLLPVNNKTRDAAVAEVQRRLRARESVSVIQPGWTVSVDEDPPPTDDDEFIALAIGIKFGRSVEQAFFTVTVG